MQGTDASGIPYDAKCHTDHRCDRECSRLGSVSTCGCTLATLSSAVAAACTLQYLVLVLH